MSEGPSQSWYEKPYQDMYDAAAHYVDWCEANDLDPNDEEAKTEYENRMDDARDDYLIEKAEREKEDEWDSFWDEKE